MMKAGRVLSVLLLAASVCGAQAQSSAQPASRPAKVKRKTPEQLQLEQLNEKLEKLEQDMVAMKAEAARRDKELADAKKAATTAIAAAEAASEQSKLRWEGTAETVMKQNDEVTRLQSDVADIKLNSTSVAETVQSNQTSTRALENPDTIHFMGVGLTPGGFLAAETVWRQRAISGDVNTQFTGIPFAGQSAGVLSEFNASARQSRISLLATGKLSGATLRGYYETDFLSAGTTSNNNQSNSYTLRQRQLWAQAQLNSGWIFTGGQMWSLATEYRAGLTNTREATPLTVDSQYNVGFTWLRQYGFRVVKNLNNKIWIAGSVEEPETLNIGGHNLPSLLYQQTGNPGGLYNSTANYSFNYAPDLVAKVAWEPGFGHFELYSVGRFFRARAFPNATSSPATAYGAFTSKTAGGGLGLNARVPVFEKKLEIGAHVLGGNGLGRYSTSTLPDATAHPSGTLELLVGGSALGSLEWHATPRLDVYGYYGGEYAKRAYYATGLYVTTAPKLPTDPPLGQPILTGYGAPTNIVLGCHTEVLPVASPNGGGNVPGTALGCSADNRNIQEGTFGYWYRFYRGPKGTLQQGMQYSYVVRHTWLGVGDPATGLGGSPKAIDNMWFTSFRYYLPQPQ